MARQFRLTGVKAIRALPDRTEIITDSATLDIRIGRQRVSILAKGLSTHIRRRRPLATFLYFPDEPGATVIVEERQDSCTLLISEAQAAPGNLA